MGGESRMKSETNQEIIHTTLTIVYAVGLIVMAGFISVAVMPTAHGWWSNGIIDRLTFDGILSAPMIAIGLILVWAYIRVNGYTSKTCQHCGKSI